MPNKLRIFIAAGEASSDQLGADLIKSLGTLSSNLEIKIIGGDRMQAQGPTSLFPIAELAVMGYLEVINKSFKIMRHINETVEFLSEFKPDIYIAIDSRGFNFRVVRKLKKFLPNTKYINYVSPSIWAYRYKRIYQVKELFDHQFLLYPFEAKYYEKEHIPHTFIGHPLAYLPVKKSRIAPYLYTALPGSREQEVKVMLPIFLESLQILSAKLGEIIAVFIPTLPHLVELVEKIAVQFHSATLPIKISTNPQEKDKMLSKSHGFISKSGTVSLELMRYNQPFVVAHRVNACTAFFIKKLIKVKFLSLGNILADREIVPELVQEKCTPMNIALKLLEQRQGEKVDYRDFFLQLQNSAGLPPSDLAAKVVLEYGQY